MAANLDPATRARNDAELAALNAAVDAAVAARTAWMDAHMAEYAEYPVGTDLVYRRTGEWFGTVASHYRYHAGRDPFRDTDMSIHYRTTGGDNTSRLPGGVWSVASVRDAAEAMRHRAEVLASRGGTP